MTRLSQAQTSVGATDRLTKLSWGDFVQLVLRLTVKAYRAMDQDRIAQRNWEENTFTIRLAEDYLESIAYDHSIRVDIRSKVHTQQMKDGKQQTIEAKEMDLSLFDVWERDYRKSRFVWEAKRVGDKRVDGKYGTLNSEYVHEAIYRFIEREYADGLSDAGVLGYVLTGDVGNIVNDINQSMGRIRKNKPLPNTNHLQAAQSVDSFDDVYFSVHTRTDNTSVCLHHLFLTFGFS